MKTIVKIFCLFLFSAIIISCEATPDDTIHIKNRKVIVDYKSQEVVLETTNLATNINYDTQNTTGCVEPPEDNVYEYAREDHKYILKGPWFRIWYSYQERNKVVVELEENNTGAERHVSIAVDRFGYGTSAVVTQLPKPE